MRSFHALVYDDVVAGTSATYTPSHFNDLLGSVESLSIFVSAAQATGTSPTLTVQIEQGPDQIRWENRNTTAEINGVSLSASTDNIETANDGDPTGTTRLTYARLRIQLGGTSPEARVKVWVTGRGEVFNVHV